MYIPRDSVPTEGFQPPLEDEAKGNRADPVLIVVNDALLLQLFRFRSAFIKLARSVFDATILKPKRGTMDKSPPSSKSLMLFLHGIGNATIDETCHYLAP